MAIPTKTKEAVKAAATKSTPAAGSKGQHPKLAPKPEAKAEKAPKAPKEPKERKPSPHTLARQLVSENKWTNQEIFEKVTKEFPDSGFKKAYVSIKRWDLNAAEHGPDWQEKGVKPKFVELVEFNGKRVPKADVPKPEKKARAKRTPVDPAKDPLNTVAGLGIAPSAKKAAASKAAPAATKAPAAAKKG